jgi:hypothetical protein
MNTQQPISTLLSMNKPIEPPPVNSQTTLNHHVQTSSITTNVPSRSSNKSFSNRLGMTIPNQTQNSVIQESKSILSSHEPTSQKSKSSAAVKQSTFSPNDKILNERPLNEISSPSPPKCNFFLN